MQCKKALEEAGGDIEKAVIMLRKQGAASAAKKGDRTLGAGIVSAYIHANGAVGSMVELGCETDFVSGNAEFKAFAYDIAMHIAAANPEFLKVEEITEEARQRAKEVFQKEIADMPNQPKPEMMETILAGKLDAYFKEKVLGEQLFIKNPELSINDLVNNAIQKFGEKIEVTRFVRFGLLS